MKSEVGVLMKKTLKYGQKIGNEESRMWCNILKMILTTIYFLALVCQLGCK